MDPITAKLMSAAGAAAAGGGALYVDDVFSPYLYTGTGASLSINNGIDLAGEGGAVWLKARSSQTYRNHTIVDSERGKDTSDSYKVLFPNLTDASYSPGSAANATVSSFNSNGFTAGNNSNTNVSDGSYASWSFRKAFGFLDIITYTGNGTAGRTVSHSLGSVPGMIIVKSLVGDVWTIYHRSLGATKAIYFNDDTSHTNTGFWNDTAPTSTVFSVGTIDQTNKNGDAFVAYVFAHDDASFGTNEDESIIKCGSYTGNGNAAGPTIDLGFEPQYVLIKGDYGSTGWQIADSMRGVHTGGTDSLLLANSTDAEDSGNNRLDFTSTGFNIVTSANDFNVNSGTYIYMAIRRPHKPLSAGTEVFQASTASSYAGTDDIPCNFAPDFFIAKSRTLVNNFFAEPRLTDKWMVTNGTDVESSTNYFDWDGPGGKVNLTGTAFGGDPIFWQFKRAPGFMDVVAYAGTGSSQNVTHNLGVIPKLMLIKARNVAQQWMVYTSAIDGSHDYLVLNSTNAKADSSLTVPTSTSIILNTTSDLVNGSYNYISYLFATLAGISKVGTYSGTGSDVNVDCGFTAGARFVMIKRTDTSAIDGSSGDWYVYDSVRGIVSGNDPYILFNTTAAEVTNTDYIDPLNAGFTVTSSAPAGLNASGGTYLFLAIA